MLNVAQYRFKQYVPSLKGIEFNGTAGAEKGNNLEAKLEATFKIIILSNIQHYNNIIHVVLNETV